MPEMPTDNWIQTYKGRVWSFQNSKVSCIHTMDIAASISKLCRWNGHTLVFYSVAEHSVRMGDELKRRGHSPLIQLLAYLHDAHEAYISDISRPLAKEIAPEKIDKLKASHDAKIFTHFGIMDKITDKEWNIVKHADNVMLFSERDQLLRRCSRAWDDIADPGERIDLFEAGWSPDHARTRWLNSVSLAYLEVNK